MYRLTGEISEDGKVETLIGLFEAGERNYTERMVLIEQRLVDDVERLGHPGVLLKIPLRQLEEALDCLKEGFEAPTDSYHRGYP